MWFNQGSIHLVSCTWADMPQGYSIKFKQCWEEVRISQEKEFSMMKIWDEEDFTHWPRLIFRHTKSISNAVLISTSWNSTAELHSRVFHIWSAWQDSHICLPEGDQLCVTTRRHVWEASAEIHFMPLAGHARIFSSLPFMPSLSLQQTTPLHSC